MRTDELQIGDWVQERNGMPMRVNGIFSDDALYLDFDGNEGDVWEEDAEDVSGLPLTMEMLERNGYEGKAIPGRVFLFSADGVSLIRVEWNSREEVISVYIANDGKGDKMGIRRGDWMTLGIRPFCVHHLQQMMRQCGYYELAHKFRID